MQIIDSEGRVFGLINVVDLAAILMVLAFVTGGAVLVFGPGQSSQTATVEFEATVNSDVAQAALSESADMQGGEIVSGPMILESWYNESERQGYAQILFVARMDVQEIPAGYETVDSEQIFVGTDLAVNLGITRFDARVSRFEPVDSQEGGTDR